MRNRRDESWRVRVAVLEERVAVLEERVAGHDIRYEQRYQHTERATEAAARDAARELQSGADRRFDELTGKIDTLTQRLDVTQRRGMGMSAFAGWIIGGEAVLVEVVRWVATK